MFAKNFWSAGGKQVSHKEFLQELSTTVPSPDKTVTLLTVLKKNTSGAGRSQSNRDPRTVSGEAVYAGGKRDNEAVRAREFTREELTASEKYFKSLVNFKKPKKLYEDAKTIFGADSAGDGAARWVTLGLIFDSSVVYGDSMGLAMKDANAGAPQVYTAMTKEIAKVRSDAFFYQMAMNLVNQMDLEANDKAAFFGGEIEHQLRSLTGEKTSDEFWISVMGMKLAQQSGLRAVDLEDYLKRGLAQSKGSAKILGEVKETMTVYFPGMSL